MLVTVNDYSDFKTCVAQFDANKTVLFFFAPPGFFQTVGFTRNGDLAVTLSLTTGQPSTFATDFPQAIALASSFSAAG